MRVEQLGELVRNARSVGTMWRMASSGTGLSSGRHCGFHRPGLSGGPSWNSPTISPSFTKIACSARWASSTSAWSCSPGKALRIVVKIASGCSRGASSRNQSRNGRIANASSAAVRGVPCTMFT